ncbi:MAG: MaoC family dehydratase [Rhizobiaceae bacterium]
MAKLTFATMKDHVGETLGTSAWIDVTQEMINQFAETTGDRQWIHVDVERAKRESPFRAPVAHGYLTLSLVAAMSYDIGAVPEGVAAAFNYGLDKVRFLTPVKAGAKIRMTTTLVSFEAKGPGQFLMKCSNTIEIDGEDKPALIAETLAMLVAAPQKNS